MQRQWADCLRLEAKAASNDVKNVLTLYHSCWYLWFICQYILFQIFNRKWFSWYPAGKPTAESSLFEAASRGSFHTTPDWKCSSIPTVRPIVQTNSFPNGAREIENQLYFYGQAYRSHYFVTKQSRRNWKRRLFVLVWIENILKTFELKTELFEKNGVTIIMLFPCLRFSQTQIQNDRWLLRF